MNGKSRPQGAAPEKSFRGDTGNVARQAVEYLDVEIPVARIISVTPFKHTRGVGVICPYCSKRHGHGWGWGEDRIGHRSADCTSRLMPDRAKIVAGYFVEPPDYSCELADVVEWGKPFRTDAAVGVA